MVLFRQLGRRTNAQLPGKVVQRGVAGSRCVDGTLTNVSRLLYSDNYKNFQVLRLITNYVVKKEQRHTAEKRPNMLVNVNKNNLLRYYQLGRPYQIFDPAAVIVPVAFFFDVYIRKNYFFRKSENLRIREKICLVDLANLP